MHKCNAKINDLSADKINAGTISADRIGANTITAAKINTTDLTLPTNAGEKDGHHVRLLARE